MCNGATVKLSRSAIQDIYLKIANCDEYTRVYWEKEALEKKTIAILYRDKMKYVRVYTLSYCK